MIFCQILRLSPVVSASTSSTACRITASLKRSAYSAELAGRPDGGPVLVEVASALERLAGKLATAMESRD